MTGRIDDEVDQGLARHGYHAQPWIMLVPPSAWSGGACALPAMIGRRLPHRMAVRADDARATAEPLDVDPLGEIGALSIHLIPM